MMSSAKYACICDFAESRKALIQVDGFSADFTLASTKKVNTYFKFSATGMRSSQLSSIKTFPG